MFGVTTKRCFYTHINMPYGLQNNQRPRENPYDRRRVHELMKC